MMPAFWLRYSWYQ